MARNRLTTNSGETDVASLISGDTIFSIPYFQRPYKWKSERLKQLNSDILSLVDLTDVHFLGAVIIYGRRLNPSDPDVYDVIDGQQRITTIFLYLCATVKTLASNGQHQEAAALFLKYLVINRDTGALPNIKIQPSKDDRSQLNQVYLDLLSDKKLTAALGGFKLLPLPKSGSDSGTVKNNYRSAVRFLEVEVAQGGLDRLRAIYSALLNQISVVQISVSDPTNGPKIFDSLNSRQEPITIGDLVRNEVFSRVANAHPDVIERIDSDHWQPFYKKFEQKGKNLFDAYFFPFGLIKRPSLQKSEVYSSLRTDWDTSKDPEKIIQELAEFQNPFLDLHSGSNLCDHPKSLASAFERLYLTELPSSTYPFLMQLSVAATQASITEPAAIAILEVVESFLVRRATCGHEPTGLHAVFKKLWSDCEKEYTAERVAREISKHRTVAWPGDLEFAEAVATRELFGVTITPYLVGEYDRALLGDRVSIQPWIEHVLPTNPSSEWFSIFSKEQHAALKDRLANLLPLSAEMNRSLSNKLYETKKPVYEADSAFKSTREFAKQYSEWTPQLLEERSSALATWAVARWPHQRAVPQ